jgi:hypothetical protein
MQITFEMNTRELDERFIQIVKALPKDHRIKITVELLSNELESDETAFIESDPKLAESVKLSIEQIKKGDVVSLSPDAFDALAEKLERGETIDVKSYRKKAVSK